MRLIIIHKDRRKEYDIDFFSYLPHTGQLIIKVKSVGIRTIDNNKWDRIEVEK